MRIHKEYMGAASEKAAATAADIEVAGMIEKYPQDKIAEMMETTDKWDLFFHLSPVRRNTLAWYQFKENASVLEVDAGNGALTGLLCERCAHVTATVFSAYRAETIGRRYQDMENLDIYVGAVGAMKFVQEFDYIILVNSLENIPEEKRQSYLKTLDRMLKKDGCLLCAVDNRYGTRYLCGARELHTGVAYDGVNGYPRKTAGRSFDRQELLGLLNRSGFSCVKMYYPLPDLNLTQKVYSDEILPPPDIYEHLQTAYWGYDTMKGNENILCEGALRNEAFPFVAPAFLAECAHTEREWQPPCEILPEVRRLQHGNFAAKDNALAKIRDSKGSGQAPGCPDQEALPMSKKELDRLAGIKKVQLGILQEFMRICEKYDLTFWAIRGTLIGAVRHKGFIPWDDDIDVAMPRKDFDKFRAMAADELGEQFFFQSSKTDRTFFWGSMCRIRDLRTTGISEEEIGRTDKGGIGMDILVLDNLYVELRKQKRQLRRVSFWTKSALLKTYGEKNPSVTGIERAALSERLCSLMPRRFILARVESAFRACPDDKSNLYCVFNRQWDVEKIKWYNQADFQKKLDCKFEHLSIPVPEEYDHILRTSMGKYYMHYPKVENRVPKHRGVYDAALPCKHFSSKWMEDRKETLYVTGDEAMVRLFCDRFCRNANIMRLEDSVEATDLDTASADVIICADQYEEYAGKLEDRGITGYYIILSEQLEVV